MKIFIIVFLVLSAFSFVACKFDKTDDKKEVTVTFKPKVESTRDTTVYLGNYKEAEIEQAIFILSRLAYDMDKIEREKLAAIDNDYYDSIDYDGFDYISDQSFEIHRSVINQSIGKNINARIIEDFINNKYKESISRLSFEFGETNYLIDYYFYKEKQQYEHSDSIIDFRSRIEAFQDNPQKLFFYSYIDNETVIDTIMEKYADVFIQNLINDLLQYNIIIDYTDVYYNNEKTDKQALYLKISKDDFSELIPKTDTTSDEIVDYNREEFERIFNEEMERLKEKEKSD